ncbi:SUMO-targeted ubiquitin ligase complex subunit SLX8 Ecym_7137 [Eremothecium cymbalariae DBVPG|uniref:RING-type domain-containing protein n=1 Tax=Eremothecium cymbalariae (strain CBS 270.75 / DBVPG 7215 / KCTC 17166 / NRRL Y-17582) TaxID=931890 RepID=G8JVX1_ERECY|nr:hypothetical protein Ecym_7137 [Eremothecium cymbalariae DBVPG\
MNFGRVPENQEGRLGFWGHETEQENLRLGNGELRRTEESIEEQVDSEEEDGPRRKRRRVEASGGIGVVDSAGSDGEEEEEESLEHERWSSDSDVEEDEVLVGHSQRDLRALAADRVESRQNTESSEEGLEGGLEEIYSVGEDGDQSIYGGRETIDVEEEAKLQQVVKIPDEQEQDLISGNQKGSSPVEHMKASDYRCPICFDPPEAALMTPCGHVYCTVCLFQMVNSSRGYRRNGQCALCRKDVKLKEVGLIILRKKRVKKEG